MCQLRIRETERKQFVKISRNIILCLLTTTEEKSLSETHHV